MYEKTLIAGWGDMDFNSHMRNTAYLDKSADVRMMYFAENGAQPETFSSIPASMWWAVETLTTVGYGDIIPATALGRVVGSLVAILGIGLFALPAAIIGAGFVEEMAKRKLPRLCPHCKHELSDG